MAEFTVTDFADAVIRHEYGPYAAPAASVHGSTPRFGWDRFDPIDHLGMRRHLEARDHERHHEPWHHEQHHERHHEPWHHERHHEPDFGWDRFDRINHGGLGMRRHLEAWDRGWDREPWHHEPDFYAQPAPPPPPGGFGFEGRRGWRQQHHAGHGFYPMGYGEGHFVPPGYCMAPWECEDDSVIGCEDFTRHPRYVPFMAGDAAPGDPLADFDGHTLDTKPVVVRTPSHPTPSGPSNPLYTPYSTAHGDRMSGDCGGIRC